MNFKKIFAALILILTFPSYGSPPFFCSSQLSNIPKSLNFNGIINEHPLTIPMLKTELKSEDKLYQYMHLYRKKCSGTYINKYAEEYRGYIKKASSSFAIPEAFLACLLFKESRFNKSAINNGSGAKGLGQQTLVTTIDINTFLKRAHRNRNRHKELSELKERLSKKSLTKRLSNKEKRSLVNATQFLKEIRLRAGWDEYFTQLQTSPQFTDKYEKWIKHYSKESNSPEIYSYGTGTSLPAHNIGATAFWLNNTILRIKDIAPLKADTPEEMKANLLIAAAGYNIGAGAVRKFIIRRDLENKSSVDILKRLRKHNPETHSYVNSIENCMEKENNNPPHEVKSWKKRTVGPTRFTTDQICKKPKANK